MKSDNKKYYATVGLIWIACAILFFFAYMLVLEPQSQHKKNVENQLVECKNAYDAALKAAEEETQARLAGEITGLQARLKDFVVDFAEAANLTFDISETAGQQQIGAFSITSQGQEKRTNLGMPTFDNIAENYFDVSFTAGFNQFAAFLNALERHEPTMLVDEFVITRSDESQRSHQARLNLAVLVKKQ